MSDLYRNYCLVSFFIGLLVCIILAIWGEISSWMDTREREKKERLERERLDNIRCPQCRQLGVEEGVIYDWKNPSLGPWRKLEPEPYPDPDPPRYYVPPEYVYERDIRYSGSSYYECRHCSHQFNQSPKETGGTELIKANSANSLCMACGEINRHADDCPLKPMDSMDYLRSRFQPSRTKMPK